MLWLPHILPCDVYSQELSVSGKSARRGAPVWEEDGHLHTPWPGGQFVLVLVLLGWTVGGH